MTPPEKSRAHRPLAFSKRMSRLRTDEGCHLPPRGVTMPRSFNSAAMAGSEAAPAARMSAPMEDRSPARSSALACIAATAAPLPFAARRSAAAPLGFPKAAPCAFAAANAYRSASRWPCALPAPRQP